MKRFLALVLALAMMMCFGACGKNADSGADETDNTNMEEKVNSSAGGFEAPEADESTRGVSNTVGEGTTFAKGTISGDTYENSFLGLGFKLPDGDWYFYDSQQLSQMNGFDADTKTDEELEALLMGENALFYDLYAMNDKTGGGLNINIEPLNGITSDGSEFAQASAQQIMAAYAEMGYTDVETKVTATKLAGEDRVAVFAIVNLGTQALFQKGISLVNGNFRINITATTVNKDATDEILESFYALN